ncbi:DUF5983 family protein [Edwardsiella tarda]|uniref:DUF5983 family protein n=1 Tax=Edwardsiella tarda TaxID=636 RepID=UPI003D2F29D6
MTLSLIVETDVINVQRHNMARIADANIDDPFSPVTRVNGIQCSTAHITDTDNTLLFTLLHRHEEAAR